MMLPILVDATDLVHWADRADAQRYLPTLVRRLAYATVDRIEELSFAAGEGIQLGGWDGIVNAPEGNPFVPNGFSGWELGTTKGVKGKADKDYDKRCKDPRELDPGRTTFVFVTPRRWGSKATWAEAKQKDGIFRDVKAYDADDLEAWLEQAPAVHIWLSQRLGKYPQGAVSLDDYWDQWSRGTTPRTSADLTVSGRSTESDRLASWFRDESRPKITLKAESPEQAMAFFAATLLRMPPEDRERYMARCVIAEDEGAWRSLVISETPLLLVPYFDAGDVIAGAISRGHRVFLPLGSFVGEAEEAIELPRPKREGASKALLDMGVERDRAEKLARIGRRSPMALRRELSIAPGTQQPDWARSKNARDVLPALLAGFWVDNNEYDREAIAELAGRPYEDVTASLIQWSNEPDPPARLVDDTWVLASKEDVWTLLHRFLIPDDLDRFEKVAVDLLGQLDPAYDLSPDKRWAATVYGKILPHSRSLREGLAYTLALMGARSDSSRLAGSASGQERVNRVVRELLRRANTDWHLWASLSDLLPLVAEAAPDEFLRAVEAGLSSGEPVLASMFSGSEDGLLGHSPHTDLLWALERLARTRTHLSRASLALAKLALRDPDGMSPGGRRVDRPINSLCEIFMCLKPKTVVKLDDRLQVIDLIREKAPEVAWQLLRGVLPSNRNVSYGISSPEYREWTEGSEPDATWVEIFAAIDEIIDRVLKDVGNDSNRWAHIVEALEYLPKQEQRDAVTNELLSVDAARIEDPAVLLDELRRVISRHRSYPDANWSLSSEEVDRLERAYELVEPSKATEKHGWLFSDYPQLPRSLEMEWKEREEELREKRDRAVREVYAGSGASGFLEMAANVEDPRILGLTVGMSDLAEAGDENLLLDETLGSPDAALKEFGSGFASGRHKGRGWTWTDGKLCAEGDRWSKEQKAHLLSCLPLGDHVYDLLGSMDSGTRAMFWSRVSPYRIEDPDMCVRVAESFLAHQEPYQAIETLAFYAKHANSDVSTSLIARALDDVTQNPPPEPINWSIFGHYVVSLMNMLYGSDEVDEEQVAKLEWLFLSVLEQQDRTPRLLHRELSRNPGLFADFIDLVYTPDSGEVPDLSEEEQERALQAYELLQSWRLIPGTKDDGTIDADELKAWVSQARQVTASRDRAKPADRCIGSMLAASAKGSDDAWPHEAVRHVIENLGNESLERAFSSQAIANRGMYGKAHLEGGDQERALAGTYRQYASTLSLRWPRTAAVLNDIAASYERWGREEDAESELREDL